MTPYGQTARAVTSGPGFPRFLGPRWRSHVSAASLGEASRVGWSDHAGRGEAPLRGRPCARVRPQVIGAGHDAPNRPGGQCRGGSDRVDQFASLGVSITNRPCSKNNQGPESTSGLANPPHPKPLFKW